MASTFRRQSRSPVVLGIMSGTSGDGVDVAAVRIRGHGLAMRVEFVDHLQQSFPSSLRKRLLAVMAPAATRTEEIARLHADLAHAYADAALAMLDRLGRHNRPLAIGLAGQTICHLPCRVGSAHLRSFNRRGKSDPARNAMTMVGGVHPALNSVLESQSTIRNSQSAITVTLQLGNPHILAARTGIPVIADFRQSDVAAGGQGAPLVPWTDWVLLRSKTCHRAIQNIGGVGNVTFLPAGGGPESVIAFDTGPGNMVIDLLVQCITNGRQSMDRNGVRAARGRMLPEILDRWMRHPFLRQALPRTTGRETFGKPFVDTEMANLRTASRNPDDWVATATAFTAHSITDAYSRFLLGGRDGSFSPALQKPARLSSGSRRFKRHSDVKPLQVVLCGGGARNPTLARFLADALPEVKLLSIDELGIPAEAKEAVSFAVLAQACLDRVPANLPQATGAHRPACLGVRVDPP